MLAIASRLVDGFMKLREVSHHSRLKWVMRARSRSCEAQRQKNSRLIEYNFGSPRYLLRISYAF